MLKIQKNGLCSTHRTDTAQLSQKREDRLELPEFPQFQRRKLELIDLQNRQSFESLRNKGLGSLEKRELQMVQNIGGRFQTGKAKG